MNHRKAVLAASIATALAWAATSQAQETRHDHDAHDGQAHEGHAQPAPTLDSIVVRGIADSLQRSLETKRNADAIIEVLTAEDVGKFPSTNVAEAMTMIPGVTVDRQFGQGEKISILGTDPALNRTLLNGQTVASADWFITDQPGRTFNYSLLAPQLVGSVEVYKSPEPHIDEGSIGGTVIIRTRRPLDLDGTLVSGQLGYLYNDRIRSGDPQGSMLFGWKNADANFGMILAAQRSEESIRRDGIESYGTVTGHNYAYGVGGGGSIFNRPTDWSQPPNADGSQPTLPPSCAGACADTLLGNLDAIGPNSISAHYFEQQRKRDTVSLALQFQPTDQLGIEFNALNVKAGYDNMSHSMFAFNGNGWNSLMRLTDLDVEGGVITRASFAGALVVYDLINRQSTVKTDSYDLKLTWDDERWFGSAHVGTTEATGGTGRQVFGEFLNWSDYSYDISSGRSLRFGASNPFTNPDAFRIDGGYANPWHTDPPGPDNWAPGWGGNIVTKPTSDREIYGQFDVGIRLDSPVHLLRFGAKRREHKTAQSMGGVSLAAIQGYGDATASQFAPRGLPGNYLSGFGDVGDLSNRFTIDGWALANWILSGEWLAPWQQMPNPDTFNDPSFVANTWTVTEDINAAYVQADFGVDRWRGNFGFRYVQTESDSQSWQCVAGVRPCPANGYERASVRKRYSDFLPSVNVAYDAADDLVLRFSAAKVMARPNYGDMSSYLWLGDQTLTGGGGNPDLDPYRSTNLDASAEWYFSDNAILAATVFHKDVGNYILVTTRNEVHFNQNQGADTTYSVSRPDNAGRAKIKGASLAYQQNFGGGFGLLANYTYADARAATGDAMPFNSRNQVSISPFFENERWTARVNYSRRSKYYTQVDRGNYLVTRDYTSVDASLGFRINDNFSLSLDGMNLLDSEYYTYAKVDGVPNTEKLVRGAYRTGRRYMASLRFQF